jgi:hypothetical protein
MSQTWLLRHPETMQVTLLGRPFSGRPSFPRVFLIGIMTRSSRPLLEFQPDSGIQPDINTPLLQIQLDFLPRSEL